MVMRWRRGSEQRRTRRKSAGVLMELCGDCGHPWTEHLGVFADAVDLGGCGECAYEIEHGERESASICRTEVPASVIDRATAARSTT